MSSQGFNHRRAARLLAYWTERYYSLENCSTYVFLGALGQLRGPVCSSWLARAWIRFSFSYFESLDWATFGFRSFDIVFR